MTILFQERYGFHMFDGDDDAFLSWMTVNPRGFVVNTERSPDSSIAVLHRSECSHISTFGIGQPHGGFTQRGHIKVASQSHASLDNWVRSSRLRAIDLAKTCKSCKPAPH